MREKAKEYFRLGEQYSSTAELLLKTLINNGNSNMGIGNNEEEAQTNMDRSAPLSDMYLFIPTIFVCLQSAELYIKGLLLLNGETFEWSHGTESLLSKLKNSYGETSETYSKIKDFCDNQISIINNYKRANKIESSKDLYMSLRYPEIRVSTINGKENKLVF